MIIFLLFQERGFMKKFYKSYLAILIFILLLYGCTSFSLIKPVYPPVGNPNKDPDEVESLQPTLQWEGSDSPDATYDLIVFEGSKEESFWGGTKCSIGDTVCYKENLKETSYTFDKKLKPDTEYYWSIRIRRPGFVSNWSTYDWDMFLVFSYVRVSNSLFRFKTLKI